MKILMMGFAVIPFAWVFRRSFFNGLTVKTSLASESANRIFQLQI